MLLGASLIGPESLGREEHPAVGERKGVLALPGAGDMGTACSERGSWHMRAHEAAHPGPRARNRDVLIRFSDVI